MEYYYEILLLVLQPQRAGQECVVWPMRLKETLETPCESSGTM